MSGPGWKTWEEAVEWLCAQPAQQELVRACYYDRPALAAAKRFHESAEWAATRQLLPSPPGRALEVGAGHGIACYALASDGWQTTALEPDGSALIGAEAIRQLAREAGLSITVTQEVGERLPFADGVFDLVYVRQVLHHARDLRLLCRQLFRVLRPGGQLISTREHVISSTRQLRVFRERHPLHFLYGGENAYRLQEYRGALRSAGFRLSHVVRPWDSVINYAPFTRETLRHEIQRRLGVVPGGSLAGSVLNHERVLSLAMRLLSWVDRRPGRLFTFAAVRPEGSLESA